MYYLSAIDEFEHTVYWTGTGFSFFRERAKEYKTHDMCEKVLRKLKLKFATGAFTGTGSEVRHNNLMIDFD